MVILDTLYALFIGPLELFFEVLYAAAYRLVGDPGFSIIFLSLAMNFLVLPLYRRADAMQEAERERAKRMKPWTDHIKKTFKGDERFMMLQTYNRQCGYKPTDPLKGSVSLLLEIPFFIAAYNFLSHLELLQGVPFGPLADLGAPDALLQLGAVSINVLPILMTALNLLSALVYMKGLPLSNKIQMYGIAAIFLVLLYSSPSGLVFYWTLNNLFSLVKNVFYRLKRPGFVLSVLASVTGVVLLVVCLALRPLPTPDGNTVGAVLGALLQIPLIVHFLRPRVKVPFTIPEATKADNRAFLFCGLFLALFIGALIPSSVIHASPTEFVNIMAYESPLLYVLHTLAMAIGTFVIWFGVLYWLATPRVKTVFGCAMFAFAGVAVVDYLCFGLNLGNLSPELQFDNAPMPLPDEVAVNLLVVVLVAAVLAVLWKMAKKPVVIICVSMCVAVAAMSVVNSVEISQGLLLVKPSLAASDSEKPHTTISKDGRNVVVIMLDRAISYYVPYLINENPQLKEQLAGFTYYPNATSFGFFTNSGSPGLYGGYDYVPEKINERSSEPLVEKQNEALKVMPSVFSSNGFKTTFFDPTYAGYAWIPDLTIFNDLPDVRTGITMDGRYVDNEAFGIAAPEGLSRSLMRNFFCYGLFKALPVFAEPALYDYGNYNSTASMRTGDGEESATGAVEASPRLSTYQVQEGASKGTGFDWRFVNAYSVLKNMEQVCSVEEGDFDSFFVMSNDTTHSPMILKEPEYEPTLYVDNTEYDAEHAIRYAEDGSAMHLTSGRDFTVSPIIHYEIDMAAFNALGDWFDYLRENDAYDNTRIILVSDHGKELRRFPELTIDVDDGDKDINIDMLESNCLLMVKDFNATEFTVDRQFMTNADTPTLATQGLIDNPVNPYTGNPIDSSPKQAPELHLLYCYEWDTLKNNGNTFLPGHWFSVHDDIFNRDNWEYLGRY